MILREIIVQIVAPDKCQALGIYTSSYDAGRVGDSGATTLIFNRPVGFENNNLRLRFQSGYSDIQTVDLGLSNSFTLTASQTKSSSFVLQIAFTDNNGIIATSNKLTYYLTSSIVKPTGCDHKTSNDFVQELLQFAISEKVNQTTIVQEIDPEDSTKLITKLLMFNHFGTLISSIELPIKQIINQNNLIDFGKWSIAAPSDVNEQCILSFEMNYPINNISDGSWSLMNSDGESVSGYIPIYVSPRTYVNIDQSLLENISTLKIAVFNDAEGNDKLFEMSLNKIGSINNKYQYGTLELIRG